MSQGRQDQGSEDVSNNLQDAGSARANKGRAQNMLYPATDGQRQLWYLYKLNPSDDRYHKPLALTLRGHLDIVALESALLDIIERHAPLHSIFLESEGELYQQEADPKSFILEKRDLSDQTSGLGGVAESEAAEAFLKKPFDLEREMPIRALLIRMRAESHILLLVFHHIQTDGASYRLIIRELSDAYRRHVVKLETPFPPAANALRWGHAEKFYLRTPDAAADLKFWQEHLQHASPLIRWPHQNGFGQATQAPRLGFCQFSVPAGLKEAIRPYADAGAGAVLRLFLSTYALLIHRLTGLEYILIGLPVHDRRSGQDRSAVGFRMKTLPLCLHITGQMSYREIVRQLNKSLRAAYRHSRLPAGHLASLIPQAALLPGGRLFHTIFNHREDPLEGIAFEGLETTPFPVQVTAPKADISILLAKDPQADALIRDGIGIHYDQSVFGEEDIRRTGDRWMMVLKQCLQNPSVFTENIEILLPEETGPEQCLAEKGDHVEYPRTTLHQQVLAQVRRTPDRVAVITPQGVTSYGMLDVLSESLAKFLMEQGVGRETVVGIYVEKSPEFVISLMAVLRAGGAFLPISTETPESRISFMLRDASAGFCLTDRKFNAELGLGIRVLDVRRSIERSRGVRHQPDLPGVSPGSLAYVIYTSGSTGRPKGVMIEHRQILNRLFHTRDILKFGPDDRTLHRSCVSFDVWIPEVFLPLISGGSVVITESGSVNRPADIAEAIDEHAVTYVHMLPELLSVFLDMGFHAGVDRHLKTIWCGGESLSDQTLQRCLQTYSAALYHGYGPTEASVGVAYWRAANDHGYPQPPIGKPFANTILRVVDSRGRRVPPGVTGELWIGGAQTGRGYVNDPALTRDRFVEDPLEPGSGLRFYRSGDLARYLPDGQLLFMGRRDDQVKIRGQRVEPEEVATALRCCAGVREAVVLSEPDASGSLRLRGYVTVDKGIRTEGSSLRQQLSLMLPSYMLPWRIEILSSLPLTAHGKIDRSALRSLMTDVNEETVAVEPLREGLESALGDIWCEVLGLERVGRADDFFALGGHSLQALRLTGLVQSRLGLSLRLQDLYGHARLSDMSACLQEWDDRTAPDLIPSLGDIPEAPVSAGQRRMWLLDSLMPHPSAYHVTRLLRYTSGLDMVLVARVLSVLMRRHPVLRTVLEELGGALMQRVLPHVGYALPLYSEAMPSGSSRESLQDRLRLERMHRFDLSKGPLWRVLHVRFGSEDLLYFTFHHALTDEWSMRIFFTEYARLMSVDGDELHAELSNPIHRYTDYGHWQSQWLRGAEASARREYWRKSLSDLSDVLRLSPDKPVTDQLPGRQGRREIRLSSSLREGLVSYARRDGVTPFTLLLGLWQVLLYRLTGSEDVLIGTPLSERRASCWQGVMGLFLNMVPVRMRVDGGSSLRNHLQRLRTLMEDVMAHGDLPFEEIKDIIVQDAAENAASLSRYAFVWNEHNEESLSSDPLDPGPEYARRELTCQWVSGAGSLDAELIYDASRFSDAYMERLLQRYQFLIEQFIETPEIGIDESPIMLPGEEEWVRNSLESGGLNPYPAKTLHSIFRETAVRCPGTVAVLSDEQSYTYSELDQLSDEFAFRLRAAGVVRDSVVALQMSRSPRLLAWMLGVLKAGGAFLLIDPELPKARRLAMMQDAAVQASVFNNNCLQEIADIPGVILDDQEDTNGHAYPKVEDPLNDEVDDSALAYIMYTSGSTGSPKGAMVEHRNIVNRLMFTKGVFGFSDTDRTLQKSPLSFDVCITEWFLPLLSGGTVVVAGPASAVTAASIADLVERHRVTYIHFVPSLLREFLSLPDLSGVDLFLRIIRCGGESLSDDIIQSCASRLRAVLYQSYGPAETAVAVTLWRATNGHGYPKPPIGRPNANTILRVVDSRGRRVPPGVTGELWIGGAQTGRGYVNDPALTRDRFVEDPLEPGSGLRFYRSGDLARYLPDGQLLFMGRRDDQVKIRGQRVEPEEVATALRSCDGVREAVVLSEPDASGSLRLRGYVTVDKGIPTEGSSLRQQLSLMLPSYMLPWRIEILPSLPLTAHGKIDRSALRSLMTDVNEETVAVEPLREGLESALGDIWCEVLGLERVGRADDFFALGGHSLQALRLTGLVQSRLGLSLRLQDLYGHARLSDMSAWLQERDDRSEPDRIPSLGDIPEAPVSAGQRRMWLLDSLMPHPSAYHVTRLLRYTSGLDMVLVARVLSILMRRHPVLRTVLEERGDELLQRVIPHVGYALPLYSEAMPSGSSRESLQDRLRQERMHRFDLSKGPLWRVLHIRFGSEDLLYFTFHHALTDEWSMRIFFTEYTRLMSVDGDELQTELSNPTHRYTDYGHWQSQWLRGAEASARREYWRKSLSDLSDVLRLSPDKPVTDQLPGRQGRREIRLSSSLREGLVSYAAGEGVTPFTLLLGLWQVLLYRLKGIDDILIGTPLSERRAACWQGVMGLFLNMVPVRMRVDGGSSFRNHLQRLRTLMEDVMAHGDLPYSEISSLANGIESGPFHSILQLSFIITERNEALPEGVVFSDDKPHASYAADDVVFLADISGEDWSIGVKFDQDRYAAERIVMYLRVYQWLLEQVLEYPECTVDELRLLKSSEQIQLLRMGLGNRVPLPAEPLIHRIYERQALMNPHAVAIEHDGKQVSYAGLNEDANRWAGYLISEAELRPGEVVALILPQGIRHVTFVLAVMKAGAAAVPIDENLPDARINHMLTDCGARIVVTGNRGLRHLMSRHFRIDPDEGYGDAFAIDESIQCASSAPAYGMYTSGSTGMPKGIFNTHAGFSNMIASNSRAMGISSGDRIAQFSTPSFDVSLFEIFLALHNGATLVVPGRLELSVLPSFIVEKRVSVAMLTPMVVSSLDTGTLSHLRILMTGGEEARPADVTRLFDQLTYFNIYGPTEVSVWSTLQKVERKPEPGLKVPIGRPMDNYFACILDATGRLLPRGMPGELYIGGIGLGLGYHGQPDLTRHHFVKSPFRRGDLLYRTGDLAWWNDDGALVYAGRKDGQVKVMGFRVELQEVERSLEELPGICQAVVIPVRRQGGEQLLAAFIVQEGGDVMDDTALREGLAARLPRYMLPDRIHRLDKIPLNHNGKVDRRQLLQLDERVALVMSEVPSGLPESEATETEQALAGIWAELLGIKEVRPDAGFFSLGGNSLQLIRLMVMIKSRWGVEPDVARMYTHITLRSMAGLIDRWMLNRTILFSRDIRPVEVWGRGDGHPIYVMVGGAGSVEEFTKYHRIGEQLGEGFRLIILPDPDASAGRFPSRELKVLADQYARFIASGMKKGPVVLMGDCIGGIDAYATACVLQDMGISDVAVVMLDTSAPGFFATSKTIITARDAYFRLPERAGYLSEWSSRLFLQLHRKTGLGKWIHRVPQSRHQLREMAFTLGLFDAEKHADQLEGRNQNTRESALNDYIQAGWLHQQPPSSGFNAVRYRKQVPSFDPTLDDPVTHALLIGMQSGYARRRILLKLDEPMGKSDIMAARTWLRRESYKPGRFRGRIMLILSEKIYARGGMRGWDRHVDGIVEVRPGKGDHRSYLREHLVETAQVVSRAIGKLIQSFRAPGES